MKQKLFLALVIIVTAALGLEFWPRLIVGLALLNDPQAIVASLHNSGPWGLVVLVVLLILQVFLAFIPGQALMVTSGYLYGFWGGTLVTWISLALGGQLAFWLARHYGRPFASRFVSPEIFERWERVTACQGIGFYTAALVLPVFPNDAMCYVAGLGEISGRRFLAANLLGRLIASLLTAFVGAYGTQIPVAVWVGLAIIAALAFLFWKNRSLFQNKAEVSDVSL